MDEALSIVEARRKARILARGKWLHDHAATDRDVLTDPHGEYVVAESTWLNHFTKVEVKMYLPDQLQSINLD